MINKFIEKATKGENQWYKYLLTIIITFLGIQLASIPLGIYVFLKDPTGAIQGDLSIISGSNIGLALMLLTFLGGLIFLLWCIKGIHHKDNLDTITGRNKLDWRRFFFGFMVWAVLGAIITFTEILTDNSSQIIFQFNPTKFIGLFIVTILLIPFQTSFEEVLFRGYLMQGSALLFRSKWVALLLTSLAFGLMHGSNPEVKEFGFWIAMPQYIIIGVLLGYVTLKDEGMELALGIHAGNNVISCLLVTSDASALQTAALFKDTNPTASHWDSLLMLICSIVFIFISNKKFRFIKKAPFSL